MAKRLPDAEARLENIKKFGGNIKDATDERDFYKERIPQLEKMLATAQIQYEQTIKIGKEQAKKLGEIMEMLSDSGVDSITRNEAAEHCIDWVHHLVKKNGMKIRPKS
jgi:hypothetical protein